MRQGIVFILMAVVAAKALAAGGGHSDELPVYMLIKQAVNFSLFLVALGLIVKKFVPPFFSQRFERFMAHKKQAQKLREEAEKKLQHMQADLKHLQQQKASRLDEAQLEAKNQAQLKLAEAQAAAKKLQHNAQFRLKKEWARKMRQLYEGVLNQALEATVPELKNLPPEQQLQWQKDFVYLLEHELAQQSQLQKEGAQKLLPQEAAPKLPSTAWPYARALYELAAKKQQVELVLQQLEPLAAAFDAQGGRFFDHPFVSQLHRRQVVDTVLSSLAPSRILPEVKSFISLLAEKGRLQELTSIVQAYKFQHDVAQGHLRGQADGLQAEGRQRVEQLVGACQKLHVFDTKGQEGRPASELPAAQAPKPHASATQALGVVLQVGGQKFDYSVAHHLSKLKTDLTRRAGELWN